MGIGDLSWRNSFKAIYTPGGMGIWDLVTWGLEDFGMGTSLGKKHIVLEKLIKGDIYTPAAWGFGTVT